MNKKRILVVDDEQDMVFGIRMMLEARDFEVLTAFDGQEALEQARTRCPDLIILDLMLPKLDGYKVCRMLKFDEKYKQIPVIMLTARTAENEQRMGFEVGADVYLTKPFEQDHLLEKIRGLLAP